MALRLALVLVALALSLAVVPAAGPADFLSAEPVLWGARNIYSPTTLVYGGIRRLWFSGWLSASNEDAICFSWETAPGSWAAPVEVLRKPGYHVGDPTVIAHPQQPSWLFMYYTQSSPQAPTTSNVVGFASSVDGGVTWWDHGIVIGQDNGTNLCGAWSPSALVVGEEIWLYFHGNGACLGPYRVRLALNGWQFLGIDFVQVPFFAVNLDVSRQGGRFVLWADQPNLHGISRYVSDDGLYFTTHASDVNPIIGSSSALVNTPHCEMVAADHCRLYFGYSPSGSVTDFESLHRWTFQTAVE